MSHSASTTNAPTLAALSAAILIALYGFSPALRAQSPNQADSPDAEATEPSSKDAEDATELSTVVVTYKASLQVALDNKREERGQIDSIVAEDIGKFPDLNLAESLQRIPGVSITRDAGEGRNISVRGLGPDFARVRINGMEALTTTGGTDSSGGANRGRGFDFNVFASDLFNSVTVRKTASADVDEGSLGATVDLQTARPFDYDGFTFVTSGQVGYNDLSNDSDPRGAMLISNTFADGTVGALLSMAYTDRSLIEQGHSTVRWDRGNSSGGFAAASPYTAALGADVYHPRIPRYGVLEHDQQRLGITTALQFEPNPGTLFTFDGLYAKFDAERTENFLEAVSFSRTGAGKPQTIVLDGSISANGNLEYGLFDNVDVRSETRFDVLETSFTQVSLDFAQEIGDNVELNALVGSARSSFDNPIQTTVTLDHADADGYSWDYRGNNRQPIINYGFDVTDPNNWTFAPGLSEIRLRPQTTDNDFTTVEFDLSWQVNDAFRVRGGVDWKQYEFATTERRRASETAVPTLPAGTTLAMLTRVFNTSSLGGGINRWLIPDIDAFNEVFGIYSNTGTFALSDSVASVRGNNRSVTEKDNGLWIQGEFDSEMFGRPLRGDFGVRYVRTDQSSTGFALVGGQQVGLTVDRDYTDTLPSLNLVWEAGEDFLIRFGAAKVVARPGLGNLTPGVSVSVSGGSRTVTGGDPLLDPFRATTADLSFEWYFAEQSLLGLALFYKDIDSFVQTSRETRPYSSSGLPASLLEGTGASVNDDFQFNVPVNTPGGKLEGLELSWQQPFTFLPQPFDGFGAIFNYTYVDSKIQYVTSAGVASLRTDLVGLSNNAYSVTLYYERERFSIRASSTYRDDYLTNVPGRNNNDMEGTIGTRNFDVSATWRLTDNMDLTFEGINLTDEANDQYVDSVGDRASVYHFTGRQYLAGFRYKF